MSPRIRAAAWVVGYAATVGALVAGAIVAPWPTCAVLAVGAVVGLRWVLRIPLGGP